MNLNSDKLKAEFEKFTKEYENTPEYNEIIYQHFHNMVDEYPFLKVHCDVVGKYSLGYGERAFRYMWLLLHAQLKSSYKFLEIGVYKGSILSLSQVIANELNMSANIIGVTPLNPTGDKYSVYSDSNYEYDIAYLYNLLNISSDNTSIIEGLSTDDIVKQKIVETAPYDMVYIDGGHDYETVISDLTVVENCLERGGFLILDDASSLLKFKPTHTGFVGHMEVALAARDYLDNNPKFEHLFACGHNRVWRKLV